MPRGKYVDVTYRTGAGITTHRTTARAIGSDVEVEAPERSGARFISVREINKGGEVVQESRYAIGEVVAITEGQNAPLKAGKSK